MTAGGGTHPAGDEAGRDAGRDTGRDAGRDAGAAEGAAEGAAVTRALLEDGSLVLAADGAAWPAVEPWVPRVPVRPADPAAARAWLRVATGAPSVEAPAEPPALDLRGVLGWVGTDGEILLRGPGGRVSGRVVPAAGEAEVRLRDPDDAGAEAGLERFSILTLAAAFLAGRLGRTLVHAGAVVAPDGRAWLLAGGTFSGKTTTCINLIRAGWDWLADDHVVLGRGADGGVEVEGWPRRFNVDTGFAAGASRGVRARVEPAGFGPGRWRPRAPLGGLLFPRVEADTPTALLPMHPARSLSRILPQSPWLLADAPAAPGLLALLRDAARLPAWQLLVGTDSYTNPEQLRRVVSPALHQGPEMAGWGM